MNNEHEPEPNWLFDPEVWYEHHSLRKKPTTEDPDDPEPVDDRLTY